MFSILVSLETLELVSLACCCDCCGNLVLSLIFSISHIILLLSQPKTDFVFEPLSFALSVSPSPDLSEVDFSSGILH